MLQEQKVRSITLLAAPLDNDPDIETEIRGRIVAIDRRTGVLHLELEPDGRPGKFSPGSLSDIEWAKLGLNSEVTILKDSAGRHRLKMPESRSQKSGDTPAPHSPVTMVQGTGQVVQVGSYHVTVQADDGQHYGFFRSRSRGFACREGDQVSFRAIQESLEIVEILLLKRVTPGFGGSNPCDDLLGELRERTGRRAMVELARHFCAERRLDWYWITPGQEAETAATRDPLPAEVVDAIQQAAPGFQSFFSHQVRALDALNAGRHVLVLTPTASGKTYCYNPAVFQALTRDPSARALYVFPLNALLDDQVGKLEKMAGAYRRRGMDIRVDRLIGRLGQDRRNQISASPPHILATNPEMLSWLLNENAYGGWPDFLRQLRFVVLDEVHTYRSLLGLHMSGLVRRLLVACRRQGNDAPQFVLSSATVGAPEELATRLTSLPLDAFEIIGEDCDGSQQPPRHWMVINPEVEGPTNPHTMHLLQSAITLVDVLTVPKEDLNAILFAKSIRDVRFVYRTIQQILEERRRGDLKSKIESFASALLTDREKQHIYKGLHDGSLRAVVSTNALEAGIDIGELDVCIIAGFPFHVMRMRQMAGRAGRRSEGAVLYIPHPMHVVDRYYRESPDRLLTQPAETFVIDHENPYIARKHILACAATMSGGVRHQELELFGRNLDRVLQEGYEKRLIETVGPSIYTAKKRRDKNDPWAVGDMRSVGQDPYVICKALPDTRRPCGHGECTERTRELGDERPRCPNLVQLLDRQYVFREAHPGAIFENKDGYLYEVQDLQDEQKLITVTELPEETVRRTFADERVETAILNERGSRELAGEAKLVWGDVKVTRLYAGYYEYLLVPRRRCPMCHVSYAKSVTMCPTCKAPTRSYLDTTRPEYRDFPGEYREVTYAIELETIACWLVLAAQVEARLEGVSLCKIPGRENLVTQFLQTRPPFRSSGDLASQVEMLIGSAEDVYAYFALHRQAASRPGPSKKSVSVYPAFYGQCLRYHLRQRMSEQEALTTFAQVTGYPVLTDVKHVCRNCVGSVLVPAAHTLEHLVALRYPTVALGDSQDLGFTTYVLHPQTQGTTIFWYDNYDGGMGAAEKVFDLFDTLLYKALESLECECHSDLGCPLCTQTLRCDRRNEALSKTAARALLHHLLKMAPYIPTKPVYWTESEAQAQEQKASGRERASEPVRAPFEPVPPALDPFLLLRVQPHVHDQVLNKALDIRGEEIGTEVPAVSVAELQEAYRLVLQQSRPPDWEFPAGWTPFQILQVRSEASKRLAHAAYKVIIMEVHPDHNPQRRAWATEAAKLVNIAWERVQGQWAKENQG
jgi:ATP-dependent helicase YprA (DUF1998 family)